LGWGARPVEAIRTLLSCGASQLPDETRDRLLAQATAEFKAAAEQGSRVLALLIENLVHSRSPCTIWALRAACAMEPTPELLAALRLIAWAGVRRSGRRGRFEPELAGDTGSVGWSPETQRAVKALAAQALRELSAGDARGPAEEVHVGGEDVGVPASRAVCACCGRTSKAAQTMVLYSARVLRAARGEVPDYRELRLHRYEVCASCSSQRRRHTLIALTALVAILVLAILLRGSTPFLLALAAAAVVSSVFLLSARRSSLPIRLQRKALQERRAHPVLRGKPGFQIVAESVMIWPFSRPVPPGVPREATCDLCGQQVNYGEGYRLTAQQVAGSKPQAGQRAAWLVCDNCIGRFDANRQTARFECRAWWERGQKDPM